MTKGNKNVVPSRGEDSALMGFDPQYLVAAEGHVLNSFDRILKQSILFSISQTVI
jgi:hypothetical protein